MSCFMYFSYLQPIYKYILSFRKKNVKQFFEKNFQMLKIIILVILCKIFT